MIEIINAQIVSRAIGMGLVSMGGGEGGIRKSEGKIRKVSGVQK